MLTSRVLRNCDIITISNCNSISWLVGYALSLVPWVSYINMAEWLDSSAVGIEQLVAYASEETFYSLFICCNTISGVAVVLANMTAGSRQEYDWLRRLSRINMADSDLREHDWRRRLTTTPGTTSLCAYVPICFVLLYCILATIQ